MLCLDLIALCLWSDLGCLIFSFFFFFFFFLSGSSSINTFSLWVLLVVSCMTWSSEGWNKSYLQTDLLDMGIVTFQSLRLEIMFRQVCGVKHIAALSSLQQQFREGLRMFMPDKFCPQTHILAINIPELL